MALVVGAVLLPVLIVELVETLDPLLEWRGGRQVEEQGANLGSDEVIGTGCAQGDNPWCRLAPYEVEHEVVVEPSPYDPTIC
jgi:hypothetical protein